MANDTGLVEFSGNALSPEQHSALHNTFSPERWSHFSDEQLSNDAQKLLQDKGWLDQNFGLGVALGDTQRKFLMSNPHRDAEGQWVQGNTPVDISPEELQVLENKAAQIPPTIAGKATQALMGRYLEIRNQLYHSAATSPYGSSPKTLVTDNPPILATIANAAFAYEATGTGVTVHQLHSPTDLQTPDNLELKLKAIHEAQAIKREFAERIPKDPYAKPEQTEGVLITQPTTDSLTAMQRVRAALGKLKR